MKKLLCTLLIFLCAAFFSGTVEASAENSGECGENLTWRFEERTGTLTISGKGPMESYDSDFGSLCPWRDLAITQVIVKEGVTSIGSNAFNGCENITTIKLPASLEEIGICAFDGCLGLEKFTLASGSGYFAVVDDCLYNKDVTVLLRCPQQKETYEFPAGVDVTENYAFSDCRLESITFPESTRSISFAAFQNCKNLRSVTIPENVYLIDCYAFSGCESLKKIDLGQTSDLGRNVFENCTSLTSVAIPEGVTEIYEQTFMGCTALKSLILPASLITFNESALMYDEALTDIYYMGTEKDWAKVSVYTEEEESWWLPAPGEEGYVSVSDLTVHKLQATGLKLANTTSGVKLTFKAGDQAAAYRTYRKEGSGKWKKIATVKKASSYVDKQASKQGVTYQYRVRPYYKKNVGPCTEKVVTVRLKTPKITKASRKSSTKAVVKWKAQSKVSGYQIKYTAGGTSKTVYVKDAARTSCVLKGLTRGKTCKIYLRSYKKTGGKKYFSAWSKVKKLSL